MTPNEVAETARQKIAKNPELEIPMRAEWAKVEDKISAHASASKTKWKVYEVRKLNRFARLEMLTAFVEGYDPVICGQKALAKVGVE